MWTFGLDNEQKELAYQAYENKGRIYVDSNLDIHNSQPKGLAEVVNAKNYKTYYEFETAIEYTRKQIEDMANESYDRSYTCRY